MQGVWKVWHGAGRRGKEAAAHLIPRIETNLLRYSFSSSAGAGWLTGSRLRSRLRSRSAPSGGAYPPARWHSIVLHDQAGRPCGGVADHLVWRPRGPPDHPFIPGSHTFPQLLHGPFSAGPPSPEVVICARGGGDGTVLSGAAWGCERGGQAKAPGEIKRWTLKDRPVVHKIL